MSGGSQHNPNGRQQSQLGPGGWNHLGLQMSNFLARTPQAAHMSSERATWHTPTPHHLFPHTAPDPLQALKVASTTPASTVYRHTPTPPDIYRHTPTPPEKIYRHTPPPIEVKNQLFPTAELFNLHQARVAAAAAVTFDTCREDLSYGRGGVDLSVGRTSTLSVRDAPTINNLVRAARVDALLERLQPPHSVIVHPRPPTTPPITPSSPPDESDDSADSFHGAPKRKGKPERSIQASEPTLPRKPSISPEPDICADIHISQNKTPDPNYMTCNNVTPAHHIVPIKLKKPTSPNNELLTPPKEYEMINVAPLPLRRRSIRCNNTAEENISLENHNLNPTIVPIAISATLNNNTELNLKSGSEPQTSQHNTVTNGNMREDDPSHLKVKQQLNHVTNSVEIFQCTSEPVESKNKFVDDTIAIPSEETAQKDQDDSRSPPCPIAAESMNKPAEPFVEVETELEKMFAGIEEKDNFVNTDCIIAEQSNGSVTKEPYPISSSKSLLASLSAKSQKINKNKKPSNKIKRRKTQDDVPTKKTKTSEIRDGYDSGSNASSNKSRGPYIQIRGSKNSPLSVSVVNAAADEDDEGVSKKIHRRKASTDGLSTRGLHRSTLGARYDASTRDPTWVCIFCDLGPHATHCGRTLGDLFGPYLASIDCEDYRLLDEATRPASDNGSVEVWMHEDCAVWACSLLAAGARLSGLPEAVWSTRSSLCDFCSKGGATICCRKHGCNKRTHFPCSQDANWELNEDQMRALCVQHKPH